ncbi:MAG: sulfotransferase [Pseudomonadota bacterium]
MALPDFLIVGAMKCGTSTLHAQLAAQPGVFMTTPKEPNFFSDDAVFARGRAWYEGLFAAAGAGDLKGEASTHYTKLPTYPETVPRMAALLARPKIIYLVRDRMKRALSHYAHDWTMGKAGHDAEAAFATHPEFVEYSRYAMQVAPYLDAFGRDRVLVVRTEDMQADPQALLSRVGAFLGREGFCWQTHVAAENRSMDRSRRLPFHELLVESQMATALRRALVPKPVRTWIRTARAPKPPPQLSPGLSARLKAIFAKDRDDLQALFPGQELL